MFATLASERVTAMGMGTTMWGLLEGGGVKEGGKFTSSRHQMFQRRSYFNLTCHSSEDM